MKKFLEKIFKKNKVPVRSNPEELKFAQEARKQFLKLKEKGLSIPVFTL